MDKQTIISALVEGGSTRLSKVLSADALICDEWATVFLEDYSLNTKAYLKARRELNEAVQWSSSHQSIYNHPNWSKVESPACILTMLYTDASWTEVLKCIELFKPEVYTSEAGKFYLLKDKAIQSVIQYFDYKIRTENLDKII